MRDEAGIRCECSDVGFSHRLTTNGFWNASIKARFLQRVSRQWLLSVEILSRFDDFQKMW